MITCEGINDMKKEFVETVKKEILKIDSNNQENNVASLIVNDFNKYLKLEDVPEYVTTQSIVGMKYVFRGWAVKNWRNVNEMQNKTMKRLNKMLVKECVKFYSKAWVHRNETLHNPDKHK